MALSKIKTGSVEDTINIDSDTLVVDGTNNRIGMGTNSPNYAVHIKKPSGTATSVNLEQTSVYSWEVGMPASGAALLFKGGGTERMRILSSGGITFNGDTSSANALDDYEEGTWTPVAEGETTAGTGTYNYQVGSYVKIGSFVQIQASIQWTSHTGSGVFRLTGLPFTSKNTTNLFSSCSAYISELPITSNHRAMPFIRPNTSYININQANGSGGPSSVNIDSAAQILLTGTYRAE